VGDHLHHTALILSNGEDAYSGAIGLAKLKIQVEAKALGFWGKAHGGVEVVRPVAGMTLV